VITVATWNVLHRVHAENWGAEAIPKCWPKEPERIAAITEWLAGRTEQVIALQEVSGDQLADLRRALPGRTFHTLRYPRVPAPRQGSCPLSDPGEHLVLMVNGTSQFRSAESFGNDPGKGVLAVQVAETLVIATHLSGDRRRVPQLARLAELAAAHPERPVLLLGDFNTDRATVASGLGEGFTVAALPPGSPPTRLHRPHAETHTVDHVVVRDATIVDTAVESSDDLSDHNLVRAAISFRPS